MANIKIFEKAEFGQIRIDEHEGEFWFVAADICHALGIQNIRQNMDTLDDDEKGVCSIYTPGGEQQMLIVSEAGLYSLIFRSRKPEAKAFRRWVTHEVLPEIRRTGAYTSSGIRLDYVVATLEKKVDSLEEELNRYRHICDDYHKMLEYK